MFRQKSGAVVCRSCNRLVGVNDTECLNCGVRYPALWGFGPLLRGLGQDLGFLQVVIGGCGLLYIFSLLADPTAIGKGGLFGMLSPSTESLLRFGASGPRPVFGYNRWWTLLSAGWLHGGLLHIGFNLLWLKQIAPMVAEYYGAGRTILLYVISSFFGFVVSTLAGAAWVYLHISNTGAPFDLVAIPFFQASHFSVGASAAVLGLIGALVYYSRRSGSRVLSQQVWGWALILLAFGFLLPGVDNWAHFGGFGSGYLVGRWMDPLKPERIDHLLAAVVCLVLTLASLIASVLIPLPGPTPIG